jgi:AraC-like DNA-binding protein
MERARTAGNRCGLMSRGAFPEYDMARAGSESLREQGIGVVPFMHSLVVDPRRLQPHYHEFFQIFLLHGRAEVMHDFVEFTAKGSTVVFLSPGQVHRVNIRPGLSGTTVSFTQAFFDREAAPPSLLFEFPFFFPAEVQPWLSLPKGDPDRIEEAFADLQREFDAAQSGAIEILRATLCILLVRANRRYAQTHPPRTTSRATQLTRQFQLAVEQHFREWQAVADYARLLGVTANHLHDIIREQTGLAAGEIIRRRRMLDAKRLLSHSDLTVSEIGYHLGFHDPSYFSRFFRRATGNTPAEFRERIREKYQ